MKEMLSTTSQILLLTRILIWYISRNSYLYSIHLPLQPYRTSSLAAAEPKSIHELDAVLKKYAYPNKEQKETVSNLAHHYFDFTLNNDTMFFSLSETMLWLWLIRRDILRMKSCSSLQLRLSILPFKSVRELFSPHKG